MDKEINTKHARAISVLITNQSLNAIQQSNARLTTPLKPRNDLQLILDNQKSSWISSDTIRFSDWMAQANVVSRTNGGKGG